MAFLVVVLAIFWGMLRLSPRAYRPVVPIDPDEISPYLTHHLGPDFYNQAQFNEPFELVINQHGLNDILSRGLWPRQFGPVEVATPTVVFEGGRLYLMSRVDYYGLSSVLTVTARPTIDEQGRLNQNIQSVRLGLMPVTKTAFRLAEQAIDDRAAYFGTRRELDAAIRAIIANVPFEPYFYFDKQKIWIHQISLEPEHLRVWLSPENKAVYKY